MQYDKVITNMYLVEYKTYEWNSVLRYHSAVITHNFHVFLLPCGILQTSGMSVSECMPDFPFCPFGVSVFQPFHLNKDSFLNNLSFEQGK